MLTHGSLFSGIGGFDLAAEQVGWRNLFHCEWNPFCRRVLAYHFPNATSYEDITKTDFTRWHGQVDVLSGGFPCQPFSVAGERKGAEDDRYLWPEMLRAIDECRPTWIVGENVAGITSMVQPSEVTRVEEQTNLFGARDTLIEEWASFVLYDIYQDLEERGYSVQSFVIPACAVGAPHRRDRIWIVAHTDNAGAKGTERAGADVPDPLRPNADPSSKLWHKGRSDSDGQAKDPSEWADLLERADGLSREWSATDADGIRKQRECDQEQGQRQPDGRDSSYLSAEAIRERWRHFPTQSPICGGDDGIPKELLDIPFSRWRREALKAYGNAIVPEVARRIFEAINAIEMQDNYERD